jgi:predicted glycoside hydrolase/deacetylase ChbG (UPF0249 family)
MAFSVLATTSYCQSGDGSIYLVIRGDDMGSSHAANLACIDAYQNGIMQTVELMPVTPWFPEAVKMLADNPGLDVGIHLALTSEWTNMKWRPLTNVPSLVDADGYFYPMVWPNKNLPPNTSIQESNWTLNEMEKELRAQIELALKHVPHISHMGGHMGFSGLDPSIAKLMDQLAKEYQLDIDISKKNVQYMRAWNRKTPHENRVDVFCEKLEELEPGYYIFVDHPSYDVAEMQGISHPGYENVAVDREWVTRVFKSEKVKRTIERNNINLISYKDLK